MPKRDVAYYEARAARERSLAERLSPWYADKLIRTAERFEQLAERLRNPPQKVPRRLLPAESRAALSRS